MCKQVSYYVIIKGEIEPKIGQVSWQTPMDSINLHVRGGFIIPQQAEALNTKLRCISVHHSIRSRKYRITCNLFFSRQNDFNLIVALSDSEEAEGDLFWDDGESIDTINNKRYSHIRFDFAPVNNDTVRAPGIKLPF